MARKVKAARWLRALDNPGETGNKGFMVIDLLREFKRAVPFKPFVIQMVGGQRHKVTHAQTFGVSPKGSYVIVIDDKDWPHHLNPSLIKSVALGKSRRRRKKRSVDIPGGQEYKSFMVIESIREFNRAVPFKPFEIQMVSGQRYEVPHPDFVSISPKASIVIVYDDAEHPYHLSSLLIERVSPQKSHPKRKTAKH
jgi:hypothetical protein